MTWFNGLEHIVRENEPLAPWNWLRLGGPAEFFAEPTSVDELAEILKRTHAENIPVRAIGAGSNILIRDEGVTGVVLHLSAPVFCEIRVEGQEILAGGGTRLNHVVSTAAREGLAGFEAFVGIPGTVGGALRRNTIGHGAAIGQWTTAVTALTREGKQVSLAENELRFGYRESNLDNLIILTAVFKLEPGDMLKVTRQMQKLWIMKRSSHPSAEIGHAQIFADPRGISAGQIIEQAGLKGFSVGGASISEQNPNFIEVEPGTSSADVFSLIEKVRSHVSENLGVDLQPEIEVW